MIDRSKVEKLVNSLEYLTHNDRISEIVKLGRQEKDNPEVVTAIANLPLWSWV